MEINVICWKIKIIICRELFSVLTFSDRVLLNIFAHSAPTNDPTDMPKRINATAYKYLRSLLRETCANMKLVKTSWYDKEFINNVTLDMCMTHILCFHILLLCHKPALVFSVLMVRGFC